MENTLYSPPTPEQLQVAKDANKFYKVVYHNGKISHWNLEKIPQVKKPCQWCGGRTGTNI